MKVLMILPTAFPGDRGSPARVYEMSRVLSARGVDVSVVCYNEGHGRPTDVKVHRIPKLPFYKNGIGPSYSRIMLDIFLLYKALIISLRRRADLLHCHLHEGALIGLVVRKLSGIPVIFDIHSSLEKELVEQRFTNEGGIIRRLARYLDRNLPKWVNYNIGISENLLNYYKEINTNLRIKKVSSATDTDFFKPGESNLRRELQLDNNIVIGYQGNMSNLQNVSLLVEAAVTVVKIEPKVRFLIGYTSHPKDIKQLVGNKELSQSFIFIPAPYEKAPDLINCCDLMVIPRREPFGVPMKLLNFMACGKPVVLHKDVARGVTTEENKIGLHVFEDKDGLVDILLRLVEDKDLRNENKCSMLTFVHNEFSYDSLFKKLVDIYDEVLEKK